MDNSEKKEQDNLFGRSFQKDFSGATNPFSTDSFEMKNNSDNPFFVNQNSPDNTKPVVGKRINNYDSVILNNSSGDIQEGIDYRVREKESQLRELDSRIQAADSYGTQNEGLTLRAKKRRLLQEIESLKRQQKYSNRTLGGGSGSKSHSKRFSLVRAFIRFISKNILAKISANVKSVVVLSDSLEKLSEINSSIDDLLDMNVPYGEKKQNYETLTTYLNQANVIHSKITKSLRKI